MDYFKFNQELDEYLNSHKYSFYLYMLETNIEFFEESKKRLDPFKIIGSNRICLECNQFVDGIETLNLVTEFLNNIDDRYAYYFEKSLSDGNFAFCDSINDDGDFSNTAYISKNKNLYNVSFNGTITDGKTLIHEFFHYLNLDAYLVSPVFSELISIYMENKYLDFIYEKGYSKNDIAINRLFRYLSYNYSCNKLCNDSILLNIKNKIGYLDEDSYDFITKYKEQLSFPDISRKEYITSLRKMKNSIKSFKPDVNYRYFLGTVYSSHLLNSDYGLDDVLLLNDCLIYDKETSISKAFEILDLTDISFEDTIKETNDYYKPAIISYKVTVQTR